jgi:hypothetical protein
VLFRLAGALIAHENGPEQLVAYTTHYLACVQRCEKSARQALAFAMRGAGGASWTQARAPELLIESAFGYHGDATVARLLGAHERARVLDRRAALLAFAVDWLREHNVAATLASEALACAEIRPEDLVTTRTG